MGATLLTWGFVKGDVGSKQCVICDGASPGEVNAIDDWFRTAFKRQDTTPPATISHILSYGVAPLAGLGLTVVAATADERGDEAPLNALLVMQASVAAVLVKEAFSLAIRRERPYVHALDGDAKQAELAKGDPLESFPSGHVASAMAIFSAAGTIASMRGYRLAPMIWITGAILGVTISYLRMAADQHYFTDNLAGAGIGLGVGAAVPLIFHRPLGKPRPAGLRWLDGAMVGSQNVPGGRVVSVGWAF
ncbi:MAG: phosphatase PAP2 family protein [Labilithrix sp.]|nr:phosphatase PAP2 family protein [Labilithrix sp.]